MKSRPDGLCLFVTALVATALGAQAPSNAPRLSEVFKFSKEYESAMQVVIAAVTKEGMKPDEYFAEISKRGAVLHFWLIHERHDPDPSWRGDSCSKCRTIDYDSRSKSTSKVLGIK